MAGRGNIGPNLSDIPFTIYDADGNAIRSTRTMADVPDANITVWDAEVGLTPLQTITGTIEDIVVQLSDGVDDSSSQTATTGTIPSGSGRLIFARASETNLGSSGSRLAQDELTLTVGTVLTINNTNYTVAGSRNLGTASTLFYVQPAPPNGNTLRGDAVQTEGTPPADSVISWTGFASLNGGTTGSAIRTLAQDTPGGDYHVHVIRDLNMRLNSVGSLDIREDGVSAHLVNCIVQANSLQETTTAGFYWFGRQIAATTTGFNAGNSNLGRPALFTTISDDRSLSYNSCDIIFGDGGTVDAPTRLLVALSDITDSNFVFTNTNTDQVNLYPQPGAIWNNVGIADAPSVTRVATNVFISGATDFIDVDFRGMALSVVDTARAKLFAPIVNPDPTTLITQFNSGNNSQTSQFPGVALQNSGRGWAKVVNPRRTIPAAGDTTSLLYVASISNTQNGTASTTSTRAILWRQEQRYIELQQWIADFNESASAKADGININVNYSHSFGAIDDYVSLTSTANRVNYLTDTNGNIDPTQSYYVPDVGGNGNIFATDGLQIPVASFGTTNTINNRRVTDDITLLEAEFDIRSFYHDNLDVPGTRFIISKTSLDARAATADAGVAITDSTTAPLDPNIRDATLFTTGTTKRTIGDLTTYLPTLFTASTAATPQSLYESLKYFRNVTDSNDAYLAGISKPTVTAGTLNWTDGTITLDSTTNFEFATPNLTVLGNAISAVAGEPVSALNVNIVNLNNSPLTVDTTATTVDRVRLDGTGNNLAASLTATLDGTHNITTITLNSATDATLVIGDGATFASQCTVNNSGAGTITIRRATLGPADGSTLAINNLVDGTNVEFQTVAAPVAQATRLVVDLSALISTAIAGKKAWVLFPGSDIAFSDTPITDSSDTNIIGGIIRFTNGADNDAPSGFINRPTLGTATDNTFTIAYCGDYVSPAYYTFTVPLNTSTTEVSTTNVGTLGLNIEAGVPTIGVASTVGSSSILPQASNIQTVIQWIADENVTEAQCSALLRDVRGTLNYLRSMCAAVEAAGTTIPSDGTVLRFDRLQFLAQTNVNVPEAEIHLVQPSGATAAHEYVAGVYRGSDGAGSGTRFDTTGRDRQTLLNVSVETDSEGDKQVIAFPRELLSAAAIAAALPASGGGGATEEEVQAISDAQQAALVGHIYGAS